MLPFAVPDPINEYEETRFGSAEAYKRFVIIPEMIIKLKQGFGRLIRSEYDSGVVAILDFRVRVGGAYRDTVLYALPDCYVTDDIKAIETFLHAKKPPAFFQIAEQLKQLFGGSTWK